MGRGGDGQGVEAGKDDVETHKCYQMDVSKWVCKASRRPELREQCCGMLDLKLQGPGGGWESHLVFCLSSIQCCRDKLGAHECRCQSSALYSFPVWEFLVGSGVSLWAVLAPLVACLACGFSFIPHPFLELSEAFSSLLTLPLR